METSHVNYFAASIFFENQREINVERTRNCEIAATKNLISWSPLNGSVMTNF